MLAATGVLKFVNEQVADVIGDGERRVGGKLIFAAEDFPGNLRDFNEVDGTCFREDGFQLASGMAQKGEAGPNDLPVFVCIASGRKVSDTGKCLFQTGHR